MQRGQLLAVLYKACAQFQNDTKNFKLTWKKDDEDGLKTARHFRRLRFIRE